MQCKQDIVHNTLSIHQNWKQEMSNIWNRSDESSEPVALEAKSLLLLLEHLNMSYFD